MELKYSVDDKLAFYSIHRYFWLYKISYLWYAPLGFTIVFFGGWLISSILIALNLDGEPTIYMDVNRKIMNADLFSPPIAKRIRLQNAKYLENGFSVSVCDCQRS